ncbi:D-xylose ABC transporter ATP-binding protein, partial [Enterococcus hirae]
MSKKFPNIKTLSNINFKLQTNKIHTIYNKNNTNKSTLIKIINNIYQPNNKIIHYHNQTIHFTSTLKSKTTNITIIHQKLNL